jgi:hypothetical protein
MNRQSFALFEKISLEILSIGHLCHPKRLPQISVHQWVVNFQDLTVLIISMAIDNKTIYIYATARNYEFMFSL